MIAGLFQVPQSPAAVLLRRTPQPFFFEGLSSKSSKAALGEKQVPTVHLPAGPCSRGGKLRATFLKNTIGRLWRTNNPAEPVLSGRSFCIERCTAPLNKVAQPMNKSVAGVIFEDTKGHQGNPDVHWIRRTASSSS